MRLGLLVGCVVVASACGGRSSLDPGELEVAVSGSPAIAGARASGGASGKDPGAAAGRAGSSAGGPATGGVATGGSAGGGLGGVGGTSAGGASEPCQGNGRGEICNGIDDDCNGVIDDGLPLVAHPGPLTVRDDQGRTDVGIGIACDSCGWARDPQLVETDDGLGVLWFLGIWGGKEQPSAFYRRYDRTLEPLGDVSSLGPEYWMGGLRRGTPERNGAMLTFIERVGNADVSSFTFIDRKMSVPSAVPLEGCPQPGFIHTLSLLAPRAVSCLSDGSIHLFEIDESRRRLVARREQSLRLPGDTKTTSAGSAFGALRGERGLVALPIRPDLSAAPNVLWTLEISSRGEPLSEPRRQQLFATESVLLEGLLATNDGYLLFGHTYTPGFWPQQRFVVPLAPDGTLTASPTFFDKGKLSYWDDITIARVGSDIIAVTSQEYNGLTVQQLDPRGKVWSEVVALAAAYSPPALLFSRGQLYVAFTEPPHDDDENRVLLQRFSCAP